MKVRIALFTFVLFVSVFILPTPALADGIIIPDPPVCLSEPCPPTPFPISQLEIRYHHVDVFIEDQIAITRVDQVFYNPNDWTVEGTYIFPIPLDAVVSDFTLWIDGEPVKGEILSAEEARSTYEGIVREMQDPALLEYADRGAVRVRIFPIPAGGERRIQLEYTQALIADGGLVRYIYPLNTEKFSTRPLDEVRVSVDLRASQPIRAVYSPSHPVAVSRENEFHVTAGYEDYNLRPDTDFALYYSIGESEALHLLSYRDPSDPVDPDGFFLLLLAPHPDAAEQPVPKDVILVLDRSGSMEGEKFMQAQQALKYILQHLNPEDRFNVISFSTGLESYARDLRETSEVNEAAAWVERQSALGSTDINRALLEAAAMANPERPTYLIFLTDGLPTEGVIESSQILNNFASSAPQNLRVFAFGVGYDVDTFLLDSLAQEHHGTSTYVQPGEPLDEVLSSFYAKVSTPVLMDLQLDFGELAAHDLYPNPLPDLFAGSQIVVLGRYREGGRSDIILTGTVNGQTQTFTFPDQTFVTESGVSTYQSSIPRLWTTRKIGYLLNQVRLQGPEQELIDQIVHLSIRYGIVTQYTSYLVTEPLPLGAAEQDRIAEETFNEMKSAPAAPSFGQDAVEQAAGEGAMRDAESISAPPAEAANHVRIVGPRAFVRSNDAWVDTAFDPDLMQTVEVAFLSDDYFALVAADPQLGAAFALGTSVIAISDGIAYQVVLDGSTVPALEIPKPQDQQVPTDTAPPSTAAIQPDEPAADQPKPTPTSESDALTTGSSIPCVGGMLPLALFPLVGLLYIRNFKKDTTA
ncbi:VIT domain-containing protein [Chloroflexota bacterium]